LENVGEQIANLEEEVDRLAPELDAFHKQVIP
jgi:hypothetical protein